MSDNTAKNIQNETKQESSEPCKQSILKLDQKQQRLWRRRQRHSA